MADYKKMYFVLCKAADDAIEQLKQIPLAHSAVKALCLAMLEAESIYIDTTPYLKKEADPIE